MVVAKIIQVSNLNTELVHMADFGFFVLLCLLLFFSFSSLHTLHVMGESKMDKIQENQNTELTKLTTKVNTQEHVYLESTHTYRNKQSHFLAIKNYFCDSLLSIVSYKISANSGKG